MIALLGKTKLLVLAGVAAAGVVAGTQTASAHDRWSVGISLGFPFFAPSAPAPVVVVPPAPVYVPAAPVYVAPQPVYAQPVVVAPQPVYVQQPTVVVAAPTYPAPVIIAGPGFARPYPDRYYHPDYRYGGGYYYHR